MATTASVYPQTVEAFHEAVKRADVEMVEGADVKLLNAGDAQNGFTAMMWAAWMGHLAIGRTLIDLGADLAKKDMDGQDALFHACWQGEEAFARLLLEHGVAVDSADIDGETPLMAAVHKGHLGIARLLVSDYGAAIDTVDRNKMTAKDHAVRWGHYDTLKTVLEGSLVESMRKVFEDKEREADEVPPQAAAHGIRVSVRVPPPQADAHSARSSSQGVSTEEPTEATETERAETDRSTEPPAVSPHSADVLDIDVAFHVDEAAVPEVDEDEEEEGGCEESIDANSDATSLPPDSAINVDAVPNFEEFELDEVEPAAAAAAPAAPVLPEDGTHGSVSIGLWKRRRCPPLQVDTDVEADEEPIYEELPQDEEAAQFKSDVARFLDSFPPVATGCSVCELSLELAPELQLLYCQDCQDTLCGTCWKNEHQNKKRREHAPRPAITQETRFEAVAQVAVQLSRVLEKAEKQRDQALYEHSQAHQLNSVLVQEVEKEQTRRRYAEKDLTRMDQKLREINDLLHSRDAKYQAYIKDLQKRHEAEKQALRAKDEEMRRHVQRLQREVSETKRLAALREAEFKLQLQTANMRAQKATSQAEQVRVDMIRLRSENERAREEASRMRHRLDLEHMKAQRYEEENRRLLRQIHRMMPEYEQRQRSKSDYAYPGGAGAGASAAGSGATGSDRYGTGDRYGAGASGAHERSGTSYDRTNYNNYFRGAGAGATGSSAPPPPPSDGFRAGLCSKVKEALQKVKKYGLEDVDDAPVTVLHGNLSSVTIHEAWHIVGVSPYDKTAKEKAKKLMTKLHPDRSQQKAMKDSLRMRFQIVNHCRAIIIEKTDR
eukprot:Rhum_TRINITY_DN14511_c1_g1::Rhum_TRINITY_DN14511_c1_g1_i1::g.93709::m.93709